MKYRSTRDTVRWVGLFCCFALMACNPSEPDDDDSATPTATPSGAACPADGPDSDGDGVPDCRDLCPFVTDQGPDDSDHDGIGDICDLCPFHPDPAQHNLDGDSQGDLCDADMDGDGIGNAGDNCPDVANPDQLDSDFDGRGNVCAGFTVPGSFPTIQQAIDSVGAGGLTRFVTVAAGTWTECLDFADLPVTVIAAEGPDVTILEPPDNCQPVRFGPDAPWEAGLVGFTIDLLGATVSLVEERQFVVVEGGTPLLSDLRIYGPNRTGGAGIVIGGDARPRLLRTHVQGFATGMRVQEHGRPLIANVAITGNDVGCVWSALGGVGLNLVVHSNRLGIEIGPETAADIRNSIFSENVQAALVISAVDFRPDFNDLWSNGADYSLVGQGQVTAGPGSLAVNPQFVSQQSGDFTLAPGSPCIDAGDPGDGYRDAGLPISRADLGIFGGPHRPQ